MVNNIDVTLRDGGDLNNFNFTTEYAINHVETLTKSGMEWFEIGYRNGSFKPISNIGLTGMSPDSYIWDIHRAVPEAKLVVIAHPHNINADDIHAMLYNKGFPQHQIAESLGVHSSTVSRELKRNANNKQYCAKSAEILKNNRKKTAFKFKNTIPGMKTSCLRDYQWAGHQRILTTECVWSVRR
ncbi:helix-turn-helix domain-containing protein [Xenorhabdus bovienii]|uniref:helix-turn-helix domain-containing protein n=1 Tax=Xenorhabdus bovienii TaxID=40576 RepID=UPI0023B32BB5|nr:helix-turn-helix domain-containing protein [Xenorhabdus bovienii]MDE9553083.1 helix-turn-helix domain-containing protein [Xenorhabdus bovienii]